MAWMEARRLLELTVLCCVFFLAFPAGLNLGLQGLGALERAFLVKYVHGSFRSALHSSKCLTDVISLHPHKR